MRIFNKGTASWICISPSKRKQSIGTSSKQEKYALGQQDKEENKLCRRIIEVKGLLSDIVQNTSMNVYVAVSSSHHHNETTKSLVLENEKKRQ